MIRKQPGPCLWLRNATLMGKKGNKLQLTRSPTVSKMAPNSATKSVLHINLSQNGEKIAMRCLLLEIVNFSKVSSITLGKLSIWILSLMTPMLIRYFQVSFENEMAYHLASIINKGSGRGKHERRHGLYSDVLLGILPRPGVSWTRSWLRPSLRSAPRFCIIYHCVAHHLPSPAHHPLWLMWLPRDLQFLQLRQRITRPHYHPRLQNCPSQKDRQTRIQPVAVVELELLWGTGKVTSHSHSHYE